MEYPHKRYRKNHARDYQGLGWIPDYPDLRDYNLNNETDIKNKLRFKTEERTGNFERFAEEIIKLLYDAIAQNDNRKRLFKPQINLDENKIDELRNKTLGNIIFTDVKVYKILRLKDENSSHQERANKVSNDIKYEPMFFKQLTELKKYLFILIQQEYLKYDFEINHTDNGNSNGKQIPIKLILDWMREENYDSTTQEIIKIFQCRTNIKIDGIVGIETYITLNECFDNPNLLSENITLNECFDNPNLLSEAETKTERNFFKRFKFFSISSFLSNRAFEKMLKLLLLEIPEINNDEFITHEWLKFGLNQQILDKIHSELQKELNREKSINSLRDKLGINDLLKTLTDTFPDDNFIIRTNEVIETLRNSYVIEPIISVIIKLMSPLAKNRSLTFDELIEKCLKLFNDIATKIKYDHLDTTDQQAVNNIKLGYSLEELVKSAILKVVSCIREDVESIIKVIPNEKDELQKSTYVNTTFLYLLILEYLYQFHIINDIAITPDIDKYLSYSKIFDKEEIFEIDVKKLRFNNYNSSNNLGDTQEEGEGKVNWFPHLDLHIPIISNNLLRELAKYQQNNNTNQRLFFLLPGVIDLSFWFPPIRNQGSLNSCTAFAAISLLEYFENRNFGKSLDASPLFLYKAVRNKMNVQGDVGASIRETMKAMALFGVPPEESWPYEEDKVDEEPPPYCYAYAQNYKALKYFFLDYAGIPKESLLLQIKAVIAAGFPCIFGLTIYTSVYERTNYRKGHIPYPDPNKDKVIGGHTAVVVGYDDYKFIRCANRQKYSQGAFLVRNSWGTKWGANGYGWLPYDYVLGGLTAGWWSLLKADWFDESNFGPDAMGGRGDQGGRKQQAESQNGEDSEPIKEKPPNQSIQSKKPPQSR